MAAKLTKGLVLAVHPTSRGFGWALFEGPLSPVDWGTGAICKGRNGRLLDRFAKLLDRYEPAIFILEEFSGNKRRSESVQQLCRFMLGVAETRGMERLIFAQAEVRLCFAALGASNRFEIPQVIGQHIDSLGHRLPKRRGPGDGEDRRQAIFDAAALAITYFNTRNEP